MEQKKPTRKEQRLIPMSESEPKVLTRSTHTHLCEECGGSFMCDGKESVENCRLPRICRRCAELKSI